MGNERRQCGYVEEKDSLNRCIQSISPAARHPQFFETLLTGFISNSVIHHLCNSSLNPVQVPTSLSYRQVMNYTSGLPWPLHLKKVSVTLHSLSKSPSTEHLSHSQLCFFHFLLMKYFKNIFRSSYSSEVNIIGDNIPPPRFNKCKHFCHICFAIT